MDDHTFASLTRRLDRVEYQNRRLKMLGAGAGLLLLAVGVMAQALSPSRTVAAERFLLRDAVGVTHAVLGLRPNGGADLQMYDKTGNVRLALSVTEEGEPAVALMDANARQRLLLLEPATGPVVALVAPDGKDRVLIGSRDTGAAALFRDAKGTERLSLNVHADGSPSVDLLDEDGKLRAALGGTTLGSAAGIAERRPPSSLVLFDKDGKVVWKAP